MNRRELLKRTATIGATSIAGVFGAASGVQATASDGKDAEMNITMHGPFKFSVENDDIRYVAEFVVKNPLPWRLIKYHHGNKEEIIGHGSALEYVFERLRTHYYRDFS